MTIWIVLEGILSSGMQSGGIAQFVDVESVFFQCWQNTFDKFDIP
jgi:hypothetical protein